MEETLIGIAVLVGLAVGLAILILPIVAWVSARGAHAKVKELSLELVSLRGDLRVLRQKLEGASPAPAATPAPAQIPSPVVPPPPVSIPVAPVVSRRSAVSSAAPPAPPKPPAAPPPAAKAPAPAPEGKGSLEERIALVWFTRIGALAVLIGVAYFYKYAVDNEWIGPTGRLALGVLAGLGVLGFAEYTRPKTKLVYVQVILGVGLSLLYVTAYASYGWYHLFPIPAAFAAIGVVTLLGGALAIRHKGEPILILTLIGGFLCPILLSTGEDRPAALFGYLVVLTGLSFAVSIRMRFRYAIWLGIGGVAVMFAGWYDKFFDIHPPPQHSWTDVPPAQLAGAYFPFASRIAPLIAVAAFTGLWLGVYAAARRDRAHFKPVALLCTAMVLGHAGFGLLMPDHPLYLGVALVVLGAVSTWLFGLEDKRELLTLPLGASFFALLYSVNGIPDRATLGMLAVLGLWSGIYAVAFLGGQVGRAARPSPRALVLTGAVGLGFALLSGVLLLEHHPVWFGGVLAGLSLAFVALALFSEAAGVGTIAAALSLFGLIASGEQPGIDHSFIWVAAAWAAVYLGGGAWELLVKNRPPTPLKLLNLALASLGFVLLSELRTGEQEWTLRAILLAAVGAVDLALGAALLSKKARRFATPLLGQALALFAASAACLFSGFTITLIWAGFAAVVAYLASDSEDPWWLAGALALFGAALIRLLTIDAIEPGRLQDLYFATEGKQGALRQAFLLNPRAYALFGTGAAMVAAARFTGRRAAEAFRVCAGILVSLAHLLFLVLVTVEMLNLVTHTPLPPTGLTAEDFPRFEEDFLRALSAQSNRLSMIVTFVFGAYAALLVSIGFGARDRLHRYLGLGLFALALAKLGLWDWWHLERLYKMIILVAMGALLLGASFLYARFGKRLVALLKEGTVQKTAALVLALGLALAARPAGAYEPVPASLPNVRAIDGVTAPGYYRVEIDPDLYRHSRSPSLADVRIAGPSGQAAPFLIRGVPVAVPRTQLLGTLVDPVSLPGGGARAVVDLGRTGLKHSEVALTLDGADYIRRTRIEISNDERTFDVLSRGAVIFSVAGQQSSAAANTLSYPTSDARYLRITVDPGADGRPVRISGAQVALVEPASRPLVRTFPIQFLAVDAGEPGRSARQLDVGGHGVPIEALVLQIANPLFERTAWVSESTNRVYWNPVGSGVLYRDGKTEGLRLALSDARRRFLQIEVRDGDDRPLEITGATAEYAAEELVFRGEEAGPYALYTGSDAVAPPQYDLAAVLQRGGAPTMQTAHFGPFGANPAFGKTALPEGPKPLSERYPLALSGVFVAVLAALGLWTFRLLKKAKSE